jgi:hypothetical protein
MVSIIFAVLPCVVDPDHLKCVTSLENLLSARVEVDASRSKTLRNHRASTMKALTDKARVFGGTVSNLEHG